MGLPAGEVLPLPINEHKFEGVHQDAAKQLLLQ